MTDTKSLPQSTENDSPVNVDSSLAEGRSRILLFGGMGWLALGAFVDMAPIVWSSVGLVGLAFALNTAGKFVHYWELPIPRGHRLKLSASWLLLAVTVVGLLASYVSARYGAGEGRFFWALAIAGVGFGLLHMAAQSIYLPESASTVER